MRCPHCQSATATERPDRTKLGYRRFRGRACKHGFNERTGMPFNYLQYPTDVVCLMVLWRVRYKLSLRATHGQVWPVHLLGRVCKACVQTAIHGQMRPNRARRMILRRN
jgi:hypothetical protein